MSLLIRADDHGSLVVEPRLDPDNPDRVLARRHLNGRRVEDLRVPVESWPEAEEAMFREGFYETGGEPDLAIEIDRFTRTLFIAGGAPITLPNLDADPAPTLTDLAEEILDRSGVLRLTDWWRADQFAPLTAVGTPGIQHDYDRHQVAVAGQHLGAAADRLRAAVRNTDAGRTEAGARLQVLLYANPIERGFGTLLAAARRGTRVWLPEAIDAGLGRLLGALTALRLGDGVEAATIAGELVTEFQCPTHGPTQIEWERPGD